MAYDIAAALQPFNAMNAYAQGAQLGQQAKEAKTKNALMDLQVQDAQVQAGRRNYGRNAFSAILKEGKQGDMGSYLNAYMDDAAKAGDFEGYAQAADKIGAQAKSKREEDAARLTGMKTQLEVQGQLLGGVQDQASYDAAMAQAQRSGMDVTHLPREYSPQTISALRQRAMTAAQQLEQEWKAKGYSLDLAKFGETTRSNRIAEGQRSQQIGISAAQLGKPQLVQTGAGFEWVRPGQMPQGLPKGVEGKGNSSPSDTLKVIESARLKIDDATGSYAGYGIDQVNRVFGRSTEGADATAALKVLESKLVQTMPKMSGPQSDRDVQLYRDAAGVIGDPTVPKSQKLAAMDALQEITERYKGSPAPKAPASAAGQQSTSAPKARPPLSAFQR